MSKQSLHPAINIQNGLHELTDKPEQSPLWNPDLDPIALKHRRWHAWNFAALWISMVVNIATYMLGASFIGNGMNWWQAVGTIILGNVILLLPMALIGHSGTKYGIAFPVVLRLSFGTEGARYAALLRAFVACGWFGIQSWLGGTAIYTIVLVFFPALAHQFYLGAWLGINATQLASFLGFWLIQMYIVHHGINSIRAIASWAAPILIAVGIALLIWAWIKVGSMSQILDASYQMQKVHKHINFWHIFWPALTSTVGFWATVALNIPDFTRFAKSQKAQVLGPLIGLPATMGLYTFIGIAVTSATIVIFGSPIWNPIELFGKFHAPVLVVIAMLSIILATTCANIAANVVSPANDFANLWPNKISFRLGGYITGIIGIIILPWKLIADPSGYIYKWLLAYSTILGAVGGIMFCDYYLLRKTHADLWELFKKGGKYHFERGFNSIAFISFFLAIIPSMPGLLHSFGIKLQNIFPQWIISLYDYAWFISFTLAFLLFGIFTKILRKPSEY